MVSSRRSILRSDSAHMLRSEPENWALPLLMPASRPTSFTPMAVEGVEVQGHTARRPGQLQGRHPARPVDVVHFVVSLVEHAGRIHPPLNVLAPIDTWRADVLAHRKRDRPTGAVDLVGDLGSGRGCADNKHACLRELSGIAVLHRGQRRDRRRQGRSDGRHVGDVAGAGREHDGPTAPIALVRGHQVSVVSAAHRRDVRARLHRGSDRVRVAVDEIDRFPAPSDSRRDRRHRSRSLVACSASSA